MSIVELIKPKDGIIFENIDGETMIIDMNSGIYFGMNPSAGLIWNNLAEGSTIKNLSLAFIGENKNQTDLSKIESSISNFVQELKKNNLIEFIETMDSTTKPVNNEIQQRIEFQVPKLEVYEDMKEILLLDPIHDVDEEKGWPFAKETK